ncbi:uncharacterized protein B0P05DRAFT_587450 [Gilbertella persicaria]|uniref:uncharacterized protein n=1 Tax=Gilbertella persicaria TaxID=101096 RepID=UPI00222040FC|nr:uncharacterized protein B0P05DRAFT_587450 [Gilbertella persicaria]KAI8078221.1 hypothetical protein B0P05DRAFT_587450 [Gilbertella persicaria]
MRLSIASALLLVAACSSAVSASPISRDTALDVTSIEQPLNLTAVLDKRTFVCPCQANNDFIGTVMDSIRGHLDAEVFAPVSVTFAQSAAATFNINSFLGGVLNLGMSSVRSIESYAVASLRSSFSASLEAQINARIYAQIEASLRSKCGKKTLSDAQLLAILVQIHGEAKTLIHAQLPKIGAGLHGSANSCVGSAIGGIRKKIPFGIRTKIDSGAYYGGRAIGHGHAGAGIGGHAGVGGYEGVDTNVGFGVGAGFGAAFGVNFNAGATIGTSVNAGLQGCNSLSQDSFAKAVFSSL